MYAEFFGLRELPFNNTPDPRFFYATPDHEEALASLIYAVNELKGFVLLTGEVGAGKTLVARMMLRRFGNQIAFANINHALGSARELLESVCTEFDLPFDQGTSSAHLVRLLHDFLLSQFAANTPVVLVLDEAQNLPVDAFEQLRMIGNLEADDAKLLQVVIVGQPELKRMFLADNLRQLRQRIFRSFHLPRLDRELTEGYIKHRLTIGGARELDIFDEDALDRIHEFSQGLPRLINALCDNAMLSAYSSDRHYIDEEFIETVIAQMMTIEESPEELTRVGHGSTPETAQMLRRLMGRLDRLEARLGGAPQEAAPPPAAPTGTVRPAAAPHPDNPLPRALEERLNQQLTDLNELRTLRDEMRHAVERGRSASGSSPPAANQQRQNDQLNRLTDTVGGMLHETRAMLRRIEETATQTRDIQQDAQLVLERLSQQSEHSGRLAVAMRRIIDQQRRQSLRSIGGATDLGNALPDLFTSTADEVAAWSRTLTQRHAQRLEQRLREGRKGLTQLRTLIKETSNLPPPLAKPTPTEVTPDKGKDLPTARLAAQVQGLVQLIEDRGASIPAPA